MGGKDVGVDWARTFSAPGPGGRMNIVYCYEFAQGRGAHWGDVCSRCGTKRAEHVAPEVPQQKDGEA